MKAKITYLISLVLMTWLSFYLNTNAQTPDWAWAKDIGDGGNCDRELDVETDASGNVYIIGTFPNDSIIFDSIILTRNKKDTGHGDVFLVKYDSTGTVIWAKSIGGNNADAGGSIAIDSFDNIYIAGFFASDSIPFDSIILIRNKKDTWRGDIFLAKYDSAGNIIWAKSAGGNGADISKDIAIDASGNIYVTGCFTSDTITFDTTILTNNNDSNCYYSDIFLVKYNSAGNVIWARSAGDSLSDVARSFAIDNFGYIYITGEFMSRSINFASTTLINNSNLPDIFLVKYDTAGNEIWVRSAGTAGSDHGYDIVTDATGNVYLTGDFRDSSITFGSITLANNGLYDFFLVKYDSSGNAVWAKSSGEDDWDTGTGITIDLLGNIYVTGFYWSDSLTFDSITLTNYSNWYGYLLSNVFLVKYDTAGNAVWGKAIGSRNFCHSFDVTVDNFKSIYLYGTYSKNIFIDQTSLVTTSFHRIYLAKIKDRNNTGITKIATSNHIKIYPNPNNGIINIKTKGVSSEDLKVEVTNLNGQVIYSKQITNNVNQQIDLSNQPKGMYFLKLMNEDVARVEKVVIQ